MTVFRKPCEASLPKALGSIGAIESNMPEKDLPGPGTYEPPAHAEPKGAASQFNSKVRKMPGPSDHAKTPTTS